MVLPKNWPMGIQTIKSSNSPPLAPVGRGSCHTKTPSASVFSASSGPGALAVAPFFPVEKTNASTVSWFVTGRASPAAPQVPHEGGEPAAVFCDASQITRFTGAQTMPFVLRFRLLLYAGAAGALQPVAPLGLDAVCASA